MTDFHVLESWRNETMYVFLVDGSVAEGNLMGADQTGLEFELIKFMPQSDTGVDPGEYMGYEGPTLIFLPWSQIRFLTRRSSVE